MTKNEQKQIDNATKHGRGALLSTLAILHRSGSSRTQKDVMSMIKDAGADDEFNMVNGCLVYRHGN